MSNTNTTREPQALFRFHVGLITQHGARVPDKARAAARVRFTEAYPDGWTLTEGSGVYNGGSEPVWIVEVYAPDTTREAAIARGVAESLRVLLDQECIGLARIPASFQLI